MNTNINKNNALLLSILLSGTRWRVSLIFAILFFILCMLMTPVHAAVQDMGDGTILDTDTGLQLLQDANYAKTSGYYLGLGYTYDTNGGMTYVDAEAWAAGLDFAGHNDWRLPDSIRANGTVCNLMACVDVEFGHLYFLEGITSGTPGVVNNLSGAYWTSTPPFPGSDYRVVFWFVGGNSQAIWTVQDGQPPMVMSAWAVRSAQNDDLDGDGYSFAQNDCNDADININPGMTEITGNGIDDDCDPATPDLTPPPPPQDQDSDGIVDSIDQCPGTPAGNAVDASGCSASQLDSDGDGYTPAQGDCNDADILINPGAAEICDSVDNDCNAATADGSAEVWYGSVTACGTGVCSSAGELTCSAGVQADTCSAGLPPEATEVTCSDGLDNDCDGTADAADTNCTGVDYYCDVDGDTFVSSGVSGNCVGAGCEPAGCVTTPGSDCNDADILINPGAAEICDSVDNDCNAATADGSVEAWYGSLTACGTGVCSSAGELTCSAGVQADTCSAGLPPEATEVTCSDGLDNDCDGTADAADTNCTGVDYYCDVDGDTFVSSAVSGNCVGAGCEPAACQTLTGSDCNDGDISINPGAVEACDSVDNDCNAATADGSAEVWYGTITNCGTGVCSSAGELTCSAGVQADTCSAGLPPEATEVTCSDGFDNDCDGTADAADTNCTGVDYYCDVDGDTFVSSAVSGNCVGAGCEPAGCVTTPGSDCNDGDISINPNAADTANNAIDEDCNGSDLSHSITCNDGGIIECLERIDGGSDENNLDSAKPSGSMEYIFMLNVQDSSGMAPDYVKVFNVQRTIPQAADFLNVNMLCNGDWAQGGTCTFRTKLGPAAVHKFYFEVQMNNGDIYRYPDTGFISGPEIQQLTGYHLVGVPRDLGTDTIDGSTAFGCDEAFRWDADLNYYTEVNMLDPVRSGEGYFCTGQLNTLPELSEYNDNTSPTYVYELKSGWNIISNPYTGNVLLSDIMVRKGAGVPVPWIDAATNGWIVNAVYSYNGDDWGGTYGFETVDERAALIPWTGSWIYLEMTDDIYYLIIPKP